MLNFIVNREKKFFSDKQNIIFVYMHNFCLENSKYYLLNIPISVNLHSFLFYITYLEYYFNVEMEKFIFINLKKYLSLKQHLLPHKNNHTIFSELIFIGHFSLFSNGHFMNTSYLNTSGVQIFNYTAFSCPFLIPCL